VNKKQIFAVSLYGLIAGTILNHQAIAAEADERAEKAQGIEEIIVTAQKREQRLQEVSMSVTALSELDLERLGAERFSDYARTVPGISFVDQGPTARRGVQAINIRGINSVGAFLASTFATYLDETPVPDMDPNLFDVDRVEILRGPQGTLYGASSMGGAIKILTNKPDLRGFAAKIDTDVSMTRKGGAGGAVDGMINMPLIEDTLAARAVVSYRDIDGYIDRIGRRDPASAKFNVNREKTLAARFTLSWTPIEKLRIDASVFHQDAKVRSHGTYDGTPGMDLVQTRDLDEPVNERFTVYNLTGHYSLDWAEITSSSTYLRKTDIENREGTGLPELIFGPNAPFITPQTLDSTIQHEQFTQELRIASTWDKPVQSIFGFFYNDQPRSGDQHVELVDPNLPLPNIVTSDRNNEFKEVALFGELTYKPAEKWEFVAGLRWFDEKQTRKTIDSGLLAGNRLTIQEGTQKENGLTPKFSISYTPKDDILLYSLASKGFRIGGVNPPVPSSLCEEELSNLGADANTFNSDSLWNYELGAKTSWFKDRLVVNGSVYYIDWKDIQTNISLSSLGSPGTLCQVNVTANLGKASSKGVELEISAQPIKGLDIRLTGSHIDAQLEEDSPSGGGEKGEQLLNVPRWTFAASGQYTAPVFENYEAYLRIDYQYVGDRAQNFNQLDPNQDLLKYDLTHLRAGVVRDWWEVAVYVRNLFDARPVFANLRDAGLPVNKFLTTRPRTIGIQFKGQW
jgi:outer membrane receptor protein involved in Fe transport